MSKRLYYHARRELRKNVILKVLEVSRNFARSREKVAIEIPSTDPAKKAKTVYCNFGENFRSYQC